VSFTLPGSGGSWFVFMFASTFTFRFTFDRGPDQPPPVASLRDTTTSAGGRPEP